MKETCAICGKPIVFQTRCKLAASKKTTSELTIENAMLGLPVCVGHCYNGCPYFDRRISVVRCRYTDVRSGRITVEQLKK